MAEHLGIHSRKASEWIARAKARGLIGEHAGRVMAGHEITGASATYVKGKLIGASIHTRPERQPYEPNPNLAVKGVSTLVDASGNVSQQWIKTAKDKPSIEAVIKTVQDAFEGYKPATPNIQKPKDSDADKLVVYPVLDWHLGMFAYGKETSGPDWDLSIARKMLVSTFSELVDQAPSAKQAVFMGLGDLMHSDNMENKTARSGNSLDVDTRYSKVLEVTCEIMAECSEMVAAKHNDVTVTFKRGNHDDHSTIAILQALRMYYRSHNRVDVDTSPDPFYWKEFGVNLIGGTHGDKQKLQSLPMIMASRKREEWGRTTTHHLFTGHVHHERTIEVEGVKCHSLRAPIPSDAYHAGVGYLSGRSMYAFKFHAAKGSRGVIEEEIK